MKVGIMQPYFFPYLGYWQLINAVDKYVVYDDVTFIKGGWISRNNILLNGQPHMLTLPLDKPSSFRLINEIEITGDMKARQKVIKTMEAAYKKAPMYSKVFGKIEELILNSKTISELNYRTIQEMCRYLSIETEIILSSELGKDDSSSGEDKVIDICKMLRADTYINSAGGKILYSQDHFNKNDMELFFLEMGDVKYPQFGDEFVPNLSIIDVIMFNTANDVGRLLCQCSLTKG